MNQKSQRDIFPQNSYNPPIGHYNVPSISNSRQVDFGEKKQTISRLRGKHQELGPGSYFNLQKLPEIPNKLNIYAQPQIRVEQNKKRKNKISEIQKPTAPTFFTYEPSIAFVKPRLNRLVPFNQPKTVKRHKSYEDGESFCKILVGKQVEVSNEKKLFPTLSKIQSQDEEDEMDNLYQFDENTFDDVDKDKNSSIFKETSNQLNELQEHRKEIKEKVKNQKIIRKRRKSSSYEISADNLEQMILREKLGTFEMPGPGQYYNEKLFSSFSQNKIPSQLEVFISRQERFQEKKIDDNSRFYDFESQTKPKMLVNYSKMLTRVSQFKSLNNYPSVGSYEKLQVFGQKNSKEITHPAVFGSGIKRF